MSTIVKRSGDGRNVGHDLKGRRFHSLTVLERTARRSNGYIIWRARCDCGTVVELPSYVFVRSKRPQKSCGCGPTGRPRIPDQGSHVNALYANYRRAAAVRRYAFTLDKATFRAIVESDCSYCGDPPRQAYTHPNLSGVYQYNGIDRADSSIGYVPGNCVPCCTRCNFAKGKMSAAEFRAFIKKVHDHLGL